MMINEDMEWEKEAPFLAALPRITPYRVPENYFNELELQLNVRTQILATTQNNGSGFLVPANYFENLTDQINSVIALEGLKNSNDNGFKTPPEYFDKLQSSILEQTVEVKRTPKTIKFWQGDFLRYAAAACFILVVASGLYVNKQNEISEMQSVELASEQLLYNIEESLIVEHLSESQQTASQSEIENYILDHYTPTDISNNL